MGAFPACREWWLLKRYAVQDWARYGERHGQGVFKASGPKSDTGTKAQRQRLAREIKQMGANGVLVLPPEFDISLVEAVARSYETFEKQIDAANAGLAIALVGQNLTTEVKSGAYASAVVHQQVAGTIIRTDAEALNEFLHDQVLVPWAVANFGSADAAPYPVWDTKPPEDFKPKAEGWALVLGVAAQARAEGVPADVLAMAEQAGMPLLKGKKIEPPEPPEEKPQDGKGNQSNDGADGGPTEDELAAAASGSAAHDHRPKAAATKRGEKDGQEYTDRLVDSLRIALGTDLAPHLDEIVRIVKASKGDYALARMQIEDYYRESMSPTAAASLVRAGLTLAQRGGWAAVRKDTPELD